MESFLQWLQGEDRSTVSRHQQDTVSTPAATSEEVETTQPAEASMRGTSLAVDDIDVLTQRYGSLVPGMTIRIELNEACNLLGRTRRRVDAFNRLAKRLKDDYDVELKIYSQKTHE
jgi:hypothetical protein